MQDYLPSSDMRLLNIHKGVSNILPVTLLEVNLSVTISTLISSPFSTSPPTHFFLTWNIWNSLFVHYKNCFCRVPPDCIPLSPKLRTIWRTYRARASCWGPRRRWLTRPACSPTLSPTPTQAECRSLLCPSRPPAGGIEAAMIQRASSTIWFKYPSTILIQAPGLAADLVASLEPSAFRPALFPPVPGVTLVISHETLLEAVLES